MHPCTQCGVEFYASKTERANGKATCSRKCANDAQRKGILKPCQNCGKMYSVRPSSGPSRACSRACYHKLVTVNGIGRTHNGKEARLNKYGYVLIWEPGFKGSCHGWALEHRVVMAGVMGRDLDRKEEVHHKDGKRDNNHPDNLEILDPHTHGKTTGKIVNARRRSEEEELSEYRKRYGVL